MLSFFPLGVLDEIWDVAESVSHLLFCMRKSENYFFFETIAALGLKAALSIQLNE